MQKKKTIVLIGAGMGTMESLTITAQKAIQNSDVLLGATRLVSSFCDIEKKVFPFYKVQEIQTVLNENPHYQNIAILLSGDVGFYSGAKALLEAFGEEDIQVIPGISSVQYFCAKLHVSWDDVYLMSLHGRKQNFIASLRKHQRIFLLTGGENPVSEICKKMCEYGYDDVLVWIGENLSYSNERILHGTAKEFCNLKTDSLAVMLIEQTDFCPCTVTHGIRDEEFIRGDVPMTKSEVRSISLSKLKLRSDDVVYDIGAGTGSVSVEMALQAEYGTVYAIEYREKAVALIEKNKHKFGCDNLVVVAGEAPQALENLPPANCIFLGGSCGKMEEILILLIQKSKTFRIVVNAVTLETLFQTITCMEKLGFHHIETIQVAVTAVINRAGYHMLDAQNPIFITSAQFGEL